MRSNLRIALLPWNEVETPKWPGLRPGRLTRAESALKSAYDFGGTWRR